MQSPVKFVSPQDEIAAHAAAARPGRVLTAEVEAFLTGGRSVLFALTGPDGRPLAGVARGALVEPGGRLRMIASRQQNPTLPVAITQDSRIAVTFTQPMTHRSIQIKGSDAMLGKPNPEDIRATQQQARLFRDELIDLGYSVAFSSNWSAFDPADMVAVLVTPEMVFVQTPGLGAGTRLDQ
jgi:hypothetical protein